MFVPLALGAVVVALAGGILIHTRRRGSVPLDAPFGFASLYDAQTGARCEGVDLTQFTGAVAVCTNPLRFTAAGKTVDALAVLQCQGGVMNCQMTAAVAEGGEHSPTPLNDMDEVRIGEHLTLFYRSPQPTVTLTEGRML